jgi:4-hydroxybenzoate polyprenyltransferase
MTDPESGTAEPSATLRDYLELVRLPNLFTAMADVTMGFLYTHGEFGPGDPWILGLLVGASASLYAAGVVLNDVFDAAVDARERPWRPIPSGRVPLRAARRLGWGLLAVGVALAAGAAWVAGAVRPGVVAALLAGCVAAYDGVLKRTPLGPIAMGACRMLNVLLGMSVRPRFWHAEHWLVAGAVGTYIVGVTWLSRYEAGRSRRRQLALASVVILAGMAMLVPLPAVAVAPISALGIGPGRWYLLMAFLGLLTGWRCLRAVLDPEPHLVQTAVRHCIFSVVVLDAVACYVVRDVPGAITVFLFLVPAVFLGRWLEST